MNAYFAVLTVIGRIAKLLEGLSALSVGAAPAKSSFPIKIDKQTFFVQITITRKP